MATERVFMFLSNDDLKSKIVEANNKYRAGNSIMDDLTYDNLLESLKCKISQSEFELFSNSLNEGTVECYGCKVKHPFIMGSLDKIKFENPKDVDNFIKNNVKTELAISSKIDGISCRLHYSNGKLISGSTRGDGEIGTDISDKIFYIKDIPHTIDSKDSFDIRGELVILKDDFISMSGFANARNACAGIVNRKVFDKNDVGNISFISYTILGDKFSKKQQFEMLSNFGFHIPWEKYIKKCDCENITQKLFDYAIKEFDYETDGLVISDSDYINEDKYKPNSQIAFKINQLEANTILIDVNFEGPSKDGFFNPVGILDPISLGGSVISKVTLHNLDFIKTFDLKFGSIITIRKSGDIIPTIIKNVSNPEDCEEIEYPVFCKCCGSVLVRDGVNLRCQNKMCRTQVINQIVHFIKKLGVKNASYATLDNNNISSFDKLLKFVPNENYKSEVKLYNELTANVFNKSKQELLAAMNFKDVSETLINKIVDFYGLENLETNIDGLDFSRLPNGIGLITINKFKADFRDVMEIVNKFTSDSRWNNLTASKTTVGGKIESIGTICFTGSLNTMTRQEAIKQSEEVGFEVKSGVSKGLSYLVTNDTTTETTKNKKAKSFGTKIITEKEFIELISSNQVEENIDSL